MILSSKEITIAVVILLIYIASIIWGGFFSKGSKMANKSIEEFAVGSRSLNYLLVLFTVIGVFITGSIYIGWFSWGAWEGLIAQYLIIYSVSNFFLLYIFAQKIWIWGARFKLLTQPDYIKLRYRCKPLTLLSGVAGVIIEAPWNIIEFIAMGWVVNSLTGGAISNTAGIIFFGVLILGYVVYGGMKSIAITELIQGILCSLVITIGLIFAIYKLFGGFGSLFQQVYAAAPQNLTISYGGTYSYSYWASIIIAATLGGFCWASMFNRIYTTKSVLDVKKTAVLSAIIVCLFATIILIFALGGILMPEALEAGDAAFFVMCYKAFGPLFLGLVGIIIVAASMSLSSVVIASHGVIISENILREINPKITEEKRLKVSRICILVYGFVCMFMATLDLPNLALVANILYEGVIQIIPILFFGIYWRRSNKQGALAGMIVGLAIAFFFGINPEALAVFGGWTGGVLGLAANLIVHVACAFIFPKEAYVDKLFDMINDSEEDAMQEQIASA